MKPKVLIVEDDMMLRSIFENYIEDFSFQTIASVKKAKDAIEISKKQKPDVALIDIHLVEQSNDYDLCNFFSKMSIPIIFTSADSDETLSKNISLSNVYGFLQKPLYKNNLKSTILFAIAKHNNLKKKKYGKKN